MVDTNTPSSPVVAPAHPDASTGTGGTTAAGTAGGSGTEPSAGTGGTTTTGTGTGTGTSAEPATATGGTTATGTGGGTGTGTGTTATTDPILEEVHFTIQVHIEDKMMRNILRDGGYRLRVAQWFDIDETDLRFRNDIKSLASDEPKGTHPLLIMSTHNQPVQGTEHLLTEIVRQSLMIRPTANSNRFLSALSSRSLLHRETTTLPSSMRTKSQSTLNRSALARYTL
jgi:hypothetical protein